MLRISIQTKTKERQVQFSTMDSTQSCYINMCICGELESS